MRQMPSAFIVEVHKKVLWIIKSQLWNHCV